MLKLPIWSLISFFLVCALVLAKEIFKGESPFSEQFKLNLKGASWKRLAIVLGVFSTLFGIAIHFNALPIDALLCFVASLLFAYSLNLVNLSGFAKGILNLALTAGLSIFVFKEDNFSSSILALISGLSVYAIGLTFSDKQETHEIELQKPLDQILPSLIWLTGTLWIETSSVGEQSATHQSFLLIILSFVLALREIESLLPQKPFFRILLTASLGGIFAAILINNFLLAPTFLIWSSTIIGGIILTGLLSKFSLSSFDERKVADSIISLTLIGIAAVAASRLSGAFGWVLLAVCMLLSVRCRTSKLVAFFFISRTLLQVFIVNNSQNITGINLTHPYVTGALFLGFAAVLILPSFVQSRSSSSKFYLLFGGTLLAFASNYFLHEEATASLFIALLVAGLCSTVLGDVMHKFSKSPLQENILLLLPFLIVVSSLASKLIEIGNTSNKTEKLLVLAIMAIISILVYIFKHNLPHSKPVEVTGN